MKCELCQNHKAETVLYRQKDDGSQEELYVCHTCAERERVFGQERGIQIAAMDTAEVEHGAMPPIPEGILPKGMEQTMKAAFEELTEKLQEMGLTPEAILPNTECCPNCKTPLEEIRLFGHIGCPQCVKVFEASIKALLEEAQGVSVYKGEVPEAFAVIAEYQKLREAYNKAIATDDFNQAKTLSETIKEFKLRFANDANFMRFLEGENNDKEGKGE